MSTTPNPVPNKKPNPDGHVHEVRFVSYPKMLFIWPMLLAGFLFYPLAFMGSETPAGAAPAATTPDGSAAPTPAVASPRQQNLERLGWIYLLVCVFVLLTLGVDMNRNQAIFWIVFIGLLGFIGLWLRDAHSFPIFGPIARWLDGLDVLYSPGFALAMSIIMSVPYIVMIFWARLNSSWRITHNEFEHYSFGRMDDSLGRGAKVIRTEFPDVFELILGGAGTLIVYNAAGNQELRRIPHVLFLPYVRSRLNRILERTAVTTASMEEEEE